MPTNQKIQWHPGFLAGMELELRNYHLNFQSEYTLTRGPLAIDILIIRKQDDEIIDHDIGEFFRNHNIVEYKSPQDELNIDVFYKVQAYAGFYKASGEHVNEIHQDEITVSLIRDAYPRKLIASLRKAGAAIRERHPGIYEVVGVGLFPTQIITTRLLQLENHPELRVLSRNADRQDIEAFLQVAKNLKNEGDNARVDAVLQVSVSANRELYKQIWEERSSMCAALYEIMTPDFEKAEARGEARGELKGVYKTLGALVRDKILTVSEAAKRAGVSEKKFLQETGLSMM